MYFSQAASKKAEIKVSVENRVMVFVWLPKVEGQQTEAKHVLNAIQEARSQSCRVDVNVGHVAMATPNRYVSLWPGESARGNRYKVVDAAYSTIAKDIQNEKGVSDTIVTLYSLDTKAIETTFDAIQDSDDGFVLAGDNTKVRSENDRKGYNCNGLVYALLQRGGIDDITPFGSESRFAFYISPDKFDSYIKEVKAKELTKYSETKDFEKIAGEYIPTKRRNIFSKSEQD